MWKHSAPGIQFLGKDGMLFVIEYHDEQRHGKNVPSTAVDAYAIGRDSEIRIALFTNSLSFESLRTKSSGRARANEQARRRYAEGVRAPKSHQFHRGTVGP